MPPAKSERELVYKQIGVEEIDSNPLLAHLALAPETNEDAFFGLAIQPEFDISDRTLPRAIRRLRLNRLRRFFAPILLEHYRALTGICDQVFDGYIGKNPMTPEGQAFLYGDPVSSQFHSTISFIVGHSGMGKSTLVSRILNYLGEQVNRHTQFRGEAFPETQILWLRRDVPPHCTVGKLCTSFGDYTDRILHLSLYKGIFDRLGKTDNGAYLKEIRNIVVNHHVGLIVLDEFQNLTLIGVGAKKVLAWLNSLRDELCVPIVVVGTYKALKLVQKNLSVPRRLVEGGYFELKRPMSWEDPNFCSLCTLLWKYQWVRKPIDISDEIREALYEVSQGITAIVINVFITAQIAAMEDGERETIDANLIRRVFQERMGPLHRAIAVLRSGDPRLIETFDDLYVNFFPDEFLQDDLVPHLEFDSDNIQEANSKDLKEPASQDSGESKAKNKAKAKKSPIKLSEEQIKDIVLNQQNGDLHSILSET
jgi:hypothetical protein